MSAYTDEQLIMAARAYYIDQLQQAEIARLMNVSQAKISRMLNLARDRGLVQITVADSNPRDSQLEDELRKRLDIDSIVVQPLQARTSTQLRQFVGHFAAEPLRRWLEQSSNIALAGGRTIQAVIERIVKLSPLHRPQVVQAMGTVDASPGPFDAVELGLLLSRHWNSHFVRLNMPALVQDAKTCSQLFELSQAQQVMSCLADADAALVGVGTLSNSVFAERRVISSVDQHDLLKAGAVGEILGRFFDAQGRECETSFRDRVISLPLLELRKIPLRIGICTGADRNAALFAAIRSGLLNRLVIDSHGAHALLTLA